MSCYSPSFSPGGGSAGHYNNSYNNPYSPSTYVNLGPASADYSAAAAAVAAASNDPLYYQDDSSTMGQYGPTGGDEYSSFLSHSNQDTLVRAFQESNISEELSGYQQTNDYGYSLFPNGSVYNEDYSCK